MTTLQHNPVCDAVVVLYAEQAARAHEIEFHELHRPFNETEEREYWDSAMQALVTLMPESLPHEPVDVVCLLVAHGMPVHPLWEPLLDTLTDEPEST